MDAFIRIGIVGLRLILVADLEGHVFDRPIVQTDRNLLQVAKTACPVRIVLVGIDFVVPDHSRKRGSIAEEFWRKTREEFWHKMIVALDIKTVHALRRDTYTAVAADSSQKGSRGKSDSIGLDSPRVTSRICPSGFADHFEGASLKCPVDGSNAEGVIIAVGRSIAIVSRACYLNSEHRAERHAARN